MNNDDTIYCSRCGTEMKASARYCMKCGNLNYNHPENKNMEKVLVKRKVGKYEVGSGNFILADNALNSGEVVRSIANNTGSKALAFYISFGIYMLINLIFLMIGVNEEFSIISIADSFVPVIFIFNSILFLFVYSFELLFMKANERWWKALIPIYNFMIMSKIAFNNKWLGLIALIPIIGQIFLLVVYYRIGEKFKTNGLITALFSMIMIPVIAYSNKVFDNRLFVEEGTKNPVEKEYARKKISLFVPVLFLLVGIALIIYSSMVKSGGSLSDIFNSYYVYAADEMVEEVKKQDKNGSLVCESSVNSENTYYVHILDVGYDLGLKFSNIMDPIEGYVKVFRESGNTRYYVSLTDGKKGFSETLSTEISSKMISEYKKLNYDFENYTNCELKIEE